jgi:hypothetical protein
MRSLILIEKYYDIYKNHTILNECVDKQFTPIKITECYSNDCREENYNYIYEAIYNKNKHMIIKKTQDSIYNVGTFLKKMTDNIKNSYFAADNDIGPKIFDAFCVTADKYVICYILMEKYDDNLSNLIGYLNKNECIDISNKILHIFDKIGNLCFFCYDIKPTNFVLKKINEEYIIKMIDFEPDYTGDLLECYTNKNSYRVCMIIQLILFLLRENDKITTNLLIPFIEDLEVIKYIKHENIEFIDMIHKICNGPNHLLHTKYFTYCLNIDSSSSVSKICELMNIKLKQLI